MKVSILIPVYNAGPFIEEAVNSALAQEETAEIILAEDNSSDDSLRICRNLEEKHDKVLLVRHPDGKNHGAGATRNLSIRNASADFIAFLDADDFYLPERFKVAKELFDKHEDIDGVYEAIGVYCQDDASADKWKSYSDGNITTLRERVPPEKLFDLLVRTQNGTVTLDGLVVRKSLFDKSGCFFEHLRLHQDTAMIIQMAQFGRLYPGRLDIPVAVRRVHRDNRSLSEYNSYMTCYLMWETLFHWALENRIQTDRTAVIFLNYEYYLYCLATDRYSGFSPDYKKTAKLLQQTIRHPFLFIRALKEHFYRKRSMK